MGKCEIMKATKIHKKIERILDLVSSKDPPVDGIEYRWGMDTNCGNNKELIDKALKILWEED